MNNSIWFATLAYRRVSVRKPFMDNVKQEFEREAAFHDKPATKAAISGTNP